MQEESQKSRPRFQPPAQQKPAAPSPKVATATRKETPQVCVSFYKCTFVCVVWTDLYGLIELNLMSVVTCQTTEKDEAVSMKDWILRYAEQSSDEEEEEDGEEEGGKKIHNPELDEKFDPVSENTVKADMHGLVPVPVYSVFVV